jgi:hypothetical protein
MGIYINHGSIKLVWPCHFFLLKCMYQDRNVSDHVLCDRGIDNNSAHPDICDGWHCIHLWKTYAWPHLFTKRRSLGTYNYFLTCLFPLQDSESAVMGINFVSMIYLLDFLKVCCQTRWLPSAVWTTIISFLRPDFTNIKQILSTVNESS